MYKQFSERDIALVSQLANSGVNNNLLSNIPDQEYSNFKVNMDEFVKNSNSYEELNVKIKSYVKEIFNEEFFSIISYDKGYVNGVRQPVWKIFYKPKGYLSFFDRLDQFFEVNGIERFTKLFIFNHRDDEDKNYTSIFTYDFSKNRFNDFDDGFSYVLKEMMRRRQDDISFGGAKFGYYSTKEKACEFIDNFLIPLLVMNKLNASIETR